MSTSTTRAARTVPEFNNVRRWRRKALKALRNCNREVHRLAILTDPARDTRLPLIWRHNRRWKKWNRASWKYAARCIVRK